MVSLRCGYGKIQMFPPPSPPVANKMESKGPHRGRVAACKRKTSNGKDETEEEEERKRTKQKTEEEEMSKKQRKGKSE